MARARRDGTPLPVAIIDLDHSGVPQWDEIETGAELVAYGDRALCQRSVAAAAGPPRSRPLDPASASGCSSPSLYGEGSSRRFKPARAKQAK